MKYYLFILLFCLPVVGQGQIITTFAGNGNSGNLGDGGLAINSTINYPLGGVFDASGNFYFTTAGVGNSIRKVDAAGVITKIVGTGNAGFSGDGGQAVSAQLNFPHGITVDTAGNLFIADAQNHRIRKVEISTGVITTIAGDGTTNNGGDEGLALNSSMYFPQAICFDKFGNLYISAGHRIRRIDAAGIITTIAGNGISGHSGDGGLAINAQVSQPYSLATDDSNNLYIANHYSVRKIDYVTGVISKVAGNGTPGSSGDGGLALNAQVKAYYIARDKIGNLYIGEEGFNKIRRVDQQGIINTVVGTGIYGDSGDGGLALDAQIKAIFGLTLDSCGNLYISDGHSFRIRKVSFNPNCWPLNVNNTEQLSFGLYPNPAQAQIIITANGSAKDVTITNAIGQLVEQRNWSSSPKMVVDVSNFAGGIYFVTVSDANGTKLTKKLVLSRD